MKPLKCPLLKKPCIERDCMFWTHVGGMHPQTGQSIDQFDCAIKWLPMIMLENAKQTRGVQAATESMRNEVVKRQDLLNTAVALGQREIDKQIGVDGCQIKERSLTET